MVAYAVSTDINVLCLQIGAGPFICIVCVVSASYETAWWSLPNIFLHISIYQLCTPPGFTKFCCFILVLYRYEYLFL